MSKTGEIKGLFIEPFKIPSGRLLRVLLGEYGLYFSWFIALGTLALIALGFFFGYRFFILALLWIFIVLPLISFYLYIFHALKPLSAINSLPHSLVFKNDELSLTIYLSKEKKGDWGKNSGDLGKEAEDSDKTVEKTISIKDYKIGKIKKGTYGVSLFFTEPRQGMLLIPYTSLGGPSDLETLTIITSLHLST